MKKVNVQQILKETSESVTNGKTIKQLEEFKILLKKVDKESKQSLKYAIRILEEVIILKKKKNKNPFKKVYIAALLSGLFILISGSIYLMEVVGAEYPSQMYGQHVIFNLSEGHGYFGRLNVGGSHFLDLDDEFHVFGDSHLLGNLNLTGSFYVPEIANSGNLKIMPDVQGDVVLFGDTDVGNAFTGKSFYVYRRAIEGDDWVKIHISPSQKATIYSTANLIIQSDDSKYTQIVSGSHVYFDLSDNSGTNEIKIRDSGNNEVATIDSDGNAWFNGNVGIGVSNPTTPLSIMGNGGSNAVGITQNQVGGTNTMELTTKDFEGNQATRLLFRGGSNDSDTEFYTGGRGGETVSMFIEGDNGYIGFGTNNPAFELDVIGAGQFSQELYVGADAEFASQVAIGKVSPTEALDVEGNIAVTGTVDGRNLTADGTKLDNIANEFFLPAGSGILDNGAIYADESIALPDDITFARVYFTFHLPSDFSSMASGYPKVVMKPGTGGGGNVRIAFNTQSGGVGEQLGANLDNIPEYTKAVSSTSSVIIEEDISNAFDGLSLSAGDSIALYIQRDSDDGSDTLNGDLDIVGVIIKYD